MDSFLVLCLGFYAEENITKNINYQDFFILIKTCLLANSLGSGIRVSLVRWVIFPSSLLFNGSNNAVCNSNCIIFYNLHPLPND